MGLFRLVGKGVREGVEYFGGLFDDSVKNPVVSQEGLLPVQNTGVMLPVKAWDQDEYIAMFPRPEGRADSKPVKAWNAKKLQAKNMSNKEGFDHLGQRIKNFRAAEWESANPPPPEMDIPAKDRTPEQNKIVDRYRVDRYQGAFRDDVRFAEREKYRTNEEYREAEKLRNSKAGHTEEEWRAKLDRGNAAARERYANDAEYRARVNARNQEYRDAVRAAQPPKEASPAKPPTDMAQWLQDNPMPHEGISRAALDDDQWRERMNWYGRKSYHSNILKRRAANNAQGQLRRANTVTPEWANTDDLTEIHEIAAEIRDITGQAWEVHHGVPILAKNKAKERVAVGLNTPDNLLVVPQFDNRSAGNLFEAGQDFDTGGIRKARALLKKIRKEYGITE